MKKLAIIPAYNEADNILGVVNDLRENASDFDYIVINDCSTDETGIVCRKNNIPVLNLAINLGIGGAVQTGYLFGIRNDYDIAVQFDGDGQHDAKYLHRMTDELVRQKADMIIGSRFIANKGFQSSRIRRIGIKHFQCDFWDEND